MCTKNGIFVQMSAEVLDQAGPRVLIGCPRYDLRIEADEQHIIASYNNAKYCDAAEQSRDPDAPVDIIVNLEQAAHMIERKPYYALFNFQADAPAPDVKRVTMPSNPVLNDLRAGLAPITGIHTGQFVDVDKEFIDFPEFAALLSQNIIPMSVHPDSIYVSHDNIFHRFGHSKMCGDIFSRFTFAAGRTTDNHDAAYAEVVSSAFDQVAAQIGIGEYDTEKLAEYLVERYEKFMHPLAAGVLAVQDAKAQVETDKKLQRLAELHADFAAKLDAATDLDGRIDAVIELKDMVADAVIEQAIPPERIF